MTFDRRSFVLGGLAAGGTTLAAGPRPARARGANDRMRIAIIGPGRQGNGLLKQFHAHAGALNAELVAVCDLWTKRRDEAAALCTKLGGPAPALLRHPDEVYAMKDLDGVIIATPDHQHAQQLMASVRAGLDVYCEKPMANTLPEAKAAYRLGKASDRIIQLGTQRLSTGHYQAARAFVASGRLGKVSRVVHEGSFNGPRWRPVAAVKEIREADTNWKAWLAGRPARPFDPHLYFEFRVYREFSHGIPDQWLTHAIAGVHHIMDDHFPESVTASGGVLVWKDGRENSDTFHASIRYPKGFVFDYGAMFGNDYPGHNRYYGSNGTLERQGSDDGGFVVRGQGGGKRPERLQDEVALAPIAPSNHVRNWLECMRSRKPPTADILSGYAHSVVSIMAARAEQSGRRMYWDARREEILDRAPPAARAAL